MIPAWIRKNFSSSGCNGQAVAEGLVRKAGKAFCFSITVLLIKTGLLATSEGEDATQSDVPIGVNCGAFRSDGFE